MASKKSNPMKKKFDPRLIALAVGVVTGAAAVIAIASRDSDPAPSPEKTGGGGHANLDKINKLHPQMRANAMRFIGAASAAGFDIMITSTLRTIAQQDELYSYGRSGANKSKGKVTNAKGGQSYHNYGLAMDVVPIVNGKADWKTDWDRLGAIGKAQGLEWGGDFKSFVDRPHFQMSFGHTTTELLRRKNAGQTTGGYVDVK